MCPCNLLLILALGHQGKVKQMQTSHRLKQRLLKTSPAHFPLTYSTQLYQLHFLGYKVLEGKDKPPAVTLVEEWKLC